MIGFWCKKFLRCCTFIAFDVRNYISMFVCLLFVKRYGETKLSKAIDDADNQQRYGTSLAAKLDNNSSNNNNQPSYGETSLHV